MTGYELPRFLTTFGVGQATVSRDATASRRDERSSGSATVELLDDANASRDEDESRDRTNVRPTASEPPAQDEDEPRDRTSVRLGVRRRRRDRQPRRSKWNIARR